MIFNNNRIWRFGKLGRPLAEDLSDSIHNTIYNWNRDSLKGYQKHFDLVVDTLNAFH